MQSYLNTLQALASGGNLRRIPVPGSDGCAGMTDMTSNDYLGLADCEELHRSFMADEHNRRLAFTSSAARLLASAQEEYTRLEDLLRQLYPGNDALIFNSGYHANTGMISALASEPGTLIVADKLVHASIIDGITLSKAPFTRFLHNDFNRLEHILSKEHDRYDRIWVVTESVYSMDGDRTDLDVLTDLKRRYPKVMLYVDEAHGVGVEGDRGLGMCRSHSRYGEIDVIIGTLGKALASMGAFCITSATLREYAVNRARSFIFSTALPPVNVAWSRHVIQASLDMDDRRVRLREAGVQMAEGIARITGSKPVASHILPVVTGSAESAIALSDAMRRDGFKVLPIRTPTVPPGTERLRISLNASLSADKIREFLQALSRNI